MRTESSIQFLPRCFFSVSNELPKYSKIQLESRGSRKYNGSTLLYKEEEKKNIVTDIAVFQFHSHSTTYECFFSSFISHVHIHMHMNFSLGKAKNENGFLRFEILFFVFVSIKKSDWKNMLVVSNHSFSFSFSFLSRFSSVYNNNSSICALHWKNCIWFACYFFGFSQCFDGICSVQSSFNTNTISKTICYLLISM